MPRKFLLLTALILISVFASAAGGSALLKPIRFSGNGLPTLGQFSRSCSDPAKDQSTDHLDIVADYFAFSGSKFYAAIQNRGGGFPFSGAPALPPYYSYMYVLAKPGSDPKDPKTIVWALNYMIVLPGGLKPGLFKIKGKGADDLIRLADLSISLDRKNNLLIMSCEISKLLADPDFKAWFDPAHPVLKTGSITSRTSMRGFTPVTVVTDTSPGALLDLK